MGRGYHRLLTEVQFNALEALALSLVEKMKNDAAEAEKAKEEADKNNPDFAARNKKAATAGKYMLAHFASSNHRGIAQLLADCMEVDPTVVMPHFAQNKKDIGWDGPEWAGLAIILLSNPNDHDYHKNRPLFITGNKSGYARQFEDDGRFTGGNQSPHYHGRNVDSTHRTTWRYATAEEIKAEFDRIRALKIERKEDADVADLLLY